MAPLISNSPFLAALSQQREKGYAERALDSITSMSREQVLGLPVSVPLGIGAGALKGLSFGTLDLTDDLDEILGDLAPPPEIATAAELAGNIGGSFVPYIGASRVASGIFQGVGLASKIARGATTFGVPEILREALNQEIEPGHMARSLATGAAFSLPLPRLALAPVVGATELMLGADPVEAGISAGFAALFGPFEAAKRLGKSAAPRVLPGLDTEGLLGELVRGRRPKPPPFSAHTRTPFAPGSEMIPEVGASFSGSFPVTDAIIAAKEAKAPFVSEAFKHQPENPLTKAFAQSGILTPRQKSALGVGQIELPFAVSPTKSQLETILAAAENADTPEARNTLLSLAMNVDELSKQPVESLSSGLIQAVEQHGPDSPQAKTLQLALAQNRGGFVPPGANVVNPLLPPVSGIEIMTPGPTNPFEVRAMWDETVQKLRDNGGAVGRTKATQLEELMYEVRSVASKTGGKAMSQEEIAAFQARQDAITSSAEVKFANDNEAIKSFVNELSTTVSTKEVDNFVNTLPDYYRRGPEFTELLKGAALNRKSIIKKYVEPAMKGRKVKGMNAAELSNVERRASDYGAYVDIDDAGKIMFVRGGQNVMKRRFESPAEADRWIDGLEANPIRTIHELRMLAHSRGMVVDYNGKSLDIANQVTGEVLQGVGSLKQAVEAIRSAPNLAKEARPIGPRIPGDPVLPGPGSLHGLGSEQPPPSCAFSTEGE